MFMNGNFEAQKMHQNFFDRCENAIENEFYMEAILMEYAAIESRLEVMLGLLGMPCNKFMEASERKKIQISHRISCVKKFRKNSHLFEKTKLSPKFFGNLENWIAKRNIYVHGLYKNEIEYNSRMKGAKDLAEKGLIYTRLLYNEVNRLKRLKKNYPKKYENLIENIDCATSKCFLNQNA